MCRTAHIGHYSQHYLKEGRLGVGVGWADTLGSFSAILCKADNFYDFIFIFLHPYSLVKKRIDSKRKETRSNYFLL